MEAKFNKYWSTIPYLYTFAFILDPRMRMNGLFDILTLIDGHMGKNYIQTCYNDAQKRFATVYRSYEEEFQSDETQPPDVYPTMLESPVKRTFAQMASIRSSAAAAQTSSHEGSSSLQSNELEKYLATNWVQRSNTSLDVLRWWKENSNTFPILSRFARDVLTVPVSTVSSEAAFSSSGRILDDRRMSLTLDMVEILTIVRD